MERKATPPKATDIFAQGLRLRLWDYGGQGPVVLFVHGYLDTARSFDDAITELRGLPGYEGAHCLALDWRGHGQSAALPPGGSAHLLDHVKDLSCVLRALQNRGDEVKLLVAHSMGGNIALLLAGASPQLVPPRLLLLDALGAPAEEPVEQPARLGKVLEGLARVRPFRPVQNRASAMARLRATNPGLSAQAAERMCRHALVRRQGELYFAFDARLKGPTPTRWPEEMWRALCGRITAHVRVVRAQFGYVPEGTPAVERVAAMPSGTLETLESTNHHLHVEVPQWLARTIAEELAAALSADEGTQR